MWIAAALAIILVLCYLGVLFILKSMYDEEIDDGSMFDD